MQEAPEIKNSVGETVAEICGVRNLRLSCFRNYLDLQISLPEGFSLIAGANAQGKTNLLEALYLLATARLLRGVRDREAILQDQPCARVQGDLLHQTTQIEVRIEEGLKKAAFLNGMRLPRASDILGRLPCVSVSSVDLCLAQGEPSDRRLFLDLELSQRYPAYLKHLALYKRSLEHRNALLKRARESLVESRDFEPWETQIGASGAEIRRFRATHLAELAAYASETHAHLGQGEELEIRYAQKDGNESADSLHGALAMLRSEDVQRGATTIGPHRDDLAIRVGGKDARLYASQGQQRSAVISLKLATLRLGTLSGRKPMLLLDDMLSDLDRHRRERLTEWVLEYAGQAVLTCTEPHAAGERLLQRAATFLVHNGSVSPP